MQTAERPLGFVCLKIISSSSRAESPASSSLSFAWRSMIWRRRPSVSPTGPKRSNAGSMCRSDSGIEPDLDDLPEPWIPKCSTIKENWFSIVVYIGQQDSCYKSQISCTNFIRDLLNFDSVTQTLCTVSFQFQSYRLTSKSSGLNFFVALAT